MKKYIILVLILILLTASGIWIINNRYNPNIEPVKITKQNKEEGKWLDELSTGNYTNR